MLATPSRPSPRRPVATARFATLAVAGILGGLLGGCAADPTVTVSVLNLSAARISATAQALGPNRAPSDPQTISIPIGEEVAMTFPAPEVLTGVNIEITPTDPVGPGPYLVEMPPPGPFLLRVNGTADALAISRTEAAAPTGNIVPRDPRDRGYIDDIPPVNPSR